MIGILVTMAAVILAEAAFIAFFVNRAAEIFDAYERELEQYGSAEECISAEMSKTAQSVKKIWEENADE